LGWAIEYTDEFSKWWNDLTEDEMASVDASVQLLEHFGPQLRFPHSSSIEGTSVKHMRELRIQHKGQPYRVLYAFDPRRVAILLIGGNKQGNDKWYTKFIPIGEKLYKKHLERLKGVIYDTSI